MTNIVYSYQEIDPFNHTELNMDLFNNPEVSQFEADKIHAEPETWSIDTYDSEGNFYDTYLYEDEGEWEMDVKTLSEG